nr:hypothetical protein [Tanacetum cinerariifolium]
LELMLPWSLKKQQVFNAADEELSAAKHKLMMLDTAAERRLLLLSHVKTEVIINRDSPALTIVVDGVVQLVTHKFVDLWKMRIEQYFLMTDYSLWEVIINRDSPALTIVVDDQIHDRMQKLVSQLEIHGMSLSQEDVNLKFLCSLPSEWKTHTLIWRNKANLEEHSLDDLFNSLKIYKAEVNTTDSVSAATSVSAICVKLPLSSYPNIDSLSNAVIYSFLASQSTSPQLDNEDLKQIDVDDLKEMDLRWQMAMLTMRARRFLQKTGKNLGDNRVTSIGFDMSKVKCYNCHRKGYFAKDEPANFALMAITSSTSSSDNELSPYKPTQDLSHTTKPLEPIIEDWVSDSEDESKPNDQQSVPSFIQSSKQVKTPRHSVQPVEVPILDATPKPASLKSNNSKRKNRKTCFVCRSVDYLIKDCDFHAKKKAQSTPRNYAHMGNNKKNASFTHKHSPKHMVPTTVLTQSKPVSITVVRQVSAVVPKIMVTQPRHAHSIVRKSKSPIRRHITRSPSPKTSNSPLRVTAAKAPMVSAAKGKNGKWV